MTLKDLFFLPGRLLDRLVDYLAALDVEALTRDEDR